MIQEKVLKRMKNYKYKEIIVKEIISLTLAEVEKIIDKWEKTDCIDGLKKCHECILELKQKLGEEK